jgi:hypothetical protein
MNADITLRTNGASSLLVLGSSQSFTPERIDGAHTLTLSSANGIDLQADERFGSFYDFGSASSPLARIVIPEASWVRLDNTRLYAGTLDITADDVTLFGTFETTGLMDLEATRLDAAGFFRTGGGAFNAKAASVSLGGELATSGGAVTLNGPTRFGAASLASGDVLPAIRTGGGSLFVAGPVTLAADTVLQTSGGSLTLNSTVSDLNWAADDLRLDAGAGNVLLNGGIGYNSSTGAGTRIGRLSVQSARDAAFGGFLSALSLYQAAGTGTTVFRGTVDSYSYVDLNGNQFAFNAPVKTSNGGAFTVTNAGTFSTASAADFALDGAFLQDGAGSSRIAGDIRTTNDNVTFQRAVTLTGDLTIDTGAGPGNILFGSTLYGTASGQEDLTLNAGTGSVTFGGQVGYNPSTGAGVRIGNLLIRNAFNVLAQSLVTAASVRQLEGTGTTTLRGTLRTNQLPGIELTGNNFNLASLLASTGHILVRYRGAYSQTGAASPAPDVQKRV